MKQMAIWVLVLALAGLGYFLYQSESPDQTIDTVVSVLPEEISEGLRLAEQAPSDLDPERFVFQRIDINTSQELPRACLIFSQELDSSGETTYADYVRFASNVSPALTAVDNQLCIEGLDFATSYEVTLRKGMPSATGAELLYEDVLPLELADRPTMVQFGEGLILPRENVSGVPITTVNVEVLDLKVLRVGDRLLSQLERGLLDQTQLYSYEKYDLENAQGQVVWQGQMIVQGRKNQTVETLFNVRDAVTDWRPGAYVIMASDAAAKDSTDRRSYWQPSAAQWVIDSDIGLTTFQGSDGLHVIARSLETALPLPNVELALVARNNDEIARLATTQGGYAHFPQSLLRGNGGAQPAVVMAYAQGDDFNFIDLRRPAFDLTDRGVSGRSVPGPVDAYLYTERGIYRPGEEVHVVTMLRDRMAEALSDVPLTLSIRRPDGMETQKIVLNEQRSSASYASFSLSDTAPRGRWQAIAYVDTDGAPVGRVGFDVQDFVPERLEVKLDAEDAYWEPRNPVTVDVETRFLYGAPAAGLEGEAELKIMRDPNPYPDYQGYRFGRVKETFRDQVINIDIPPSDAEGFSVVDTEIPAIRETSLPLRARMRIAMYEPGGRTTRNELYRPLRTRKAMIGIRPDFEGERVREGAPASFEVIMIDRDGQSIARDNVSYRLVRENISYQWYQVRDRWQYERIVRDSQISNGVLTIEATQPARLSESLEWGQYRLMLSDAASGAESSVRFYVGWGGVSASGRPDRVSVASHKETYTVGEVAKIDIRPPVSGKAFVVIANDRVFDTQEIDVSEEGTQLEIPVSEDWGSGAYALVTVYKPLDSAATRAPVRSIGLTWLEVDQSDHTLTVAMDVPDRVTPRQKISVPLQVTGLGDGEKAHVTLAAVDQGILQLTKFKSPAPETYYFGKRRLAVDIRDDYGRLIADSDAVLGELRVGGDALGGRGLSVVPTRTVALFSGLVDVDASGAASVEFAIPDFVGELRLMAVAMSTDKVGHGETTLTIRDDVVADITLPRFLAPRDKSEAGLNIHNVDGKAGDYTVSVAVTGATSTLGGSRFEQSVTLGEDERILLSLPVEGVAPGIGTVALTLTGPEDYRVERNWPIEVRPAQMPLTEQQISLMPPGESLNLQRASLDRFYPDTASLAMTVSGSRGYDVPGLLGWLDRYPYGCLEQTVSRAYPLVYYNDMALLADVDQDDMLKYRVQSAINRVLDMQSSSGAFGMWGPSSGSAAPWLSVFALDFLFEAAKQNYIVPQDAQERGLAWLRSVAGQTYQEKWVRSYAFYVLASQGALNAGDLRYYADTELDKIANPMSAAHVAAALSRIGDKSRARVAFDRALALVMERDPEKSISIPYGTRLRDVSGVLAMAADADETRIMPALFEEAGQFETRHRYTTTQEKAWMLFTAHKLSQDVGRLNVDVKGTAISTIADPLYVLPTLTELDSGVTVTNQGETDIWKTITTSGTPVAPLAAEAAGLSFSKNIYTLDGQPAQLDQVKQNDRFVVVLRGQMETDAYREMIALDLLPAGWEIEAPLQSGDASYSWLPTLTRTDMMEARDDRFVAAFDVSYRYRRLAEGEKPDMPSFTLAYVVRAVTPGEFVLPAASVEDMYAPQVFARTDAGQLIVRAQ